MIINLSKDLVRLRHAIELFEDIKRYSSKHFTPDMNINSYVIYNNKNEIIGVCNFDDYDYFSVGILDKYQGKGILKDVIKKVFMMNKHKDSLKFIIHISNLNSIKAFVKLGATNLPHDDFAHLGYSTYELQRTDIFGGKHA